MRDACLDWPCDLPRVGRHSRKIRYSLKRAHYKKGSKARLQGHLGVLCSCVEHFIVPRRFRSLLFARSSYGNWSVSSWEPWRLPLFLSRPHGQSSRKDGRILVLDLPTTRPKMGSYKGPGVSGCCKILTSVASTITVCTESTPVERPAQHSRPCEYQPLV